MKGLGTASVLTEGTGVPITAAGQCRTRRRANLLPTGLSSLPPGRDPLEPLPPLCSWMAAGALPRMAPQPAQHRQRGSGGGAAPATGTGGSSPLPLHDLPDCQRLNGCCPGSITPAWCFQPSEHGARTLAASQTQAIGNRLGQGGNSGTGGCRCDWGCNVNEGPGQKKKTTRQQEGIL